MEVCLHYKWIIKQPLRAERRITKATLQLVGIEDKRLIDIGCCDKTFTVGCLTAAGGRV